MIFILTFFFLLFFFQISRQFSRGPHHWAYLLVAAGHVALAVFDGPSVLVHKTLKRYVIRAKRGTRQASHDAKGKMPKSAGSSLRRHNEAMLKEETRQVLTEWKYWNRENIIFLNRILLLRLIFDLSIYIYIYQTQNV